MTKDTVVAFRAPDGFAPDPLTDLLRLGARQLIAQAVEAELNGFLTAHADQTDAAGRKRLVRHGHLPEREVQTGIGAVPVKVPRGRDRAPEGELVVATVSAALLIGTTLSTLSMIGGLVIVAAVLVDVLGSSGQIPTAR